MELVHIPYSPWSERARWALDHGRIAWTSIPYTPGVSEPVLRLKLRQVGGTISVPVLFTGDEVLRDSFEIAKFVGRTVDGFVGPRTEAVNAIAERALAAGRCLAGRRVLDDPEAIAASVPTKLRMLGPVARLAAADTWRRLLRKYDPEQRPSDQHRADLVAALGEIAERLDGPYVGRAFGYADIAAASALDFVAPWAEAPLEPAVRAAWSDRELAERFHALVLWRDTLRACHRGPER